MGFCYTYRMDKKWLFGLLILFSIFLTACSPMDDVQEQKVYKCQDGSLVYSLSECDKVQEEQKCEVSTYDYPPFEGGKRCIDKYGGLEGIHLDISCGNGIDKNKLYETKVYCENDRCKKDVSLVKDCTLKYQGDGVCIDYGNQHQCEDLKEL